MADSTVPVTAVVTLPKAELEDLGEHIAYRLGALLNAAQQLEA